MTNVGVIGLGRMGGAIARAFVASGASVSGFDLSATAAAAASADGIDMQPSLADLARDVDLIVTSLPSVEAVDTVLAELSVCVKRGCIILETSTCAPSSASVWAASLASRDATFIDAPVSQKPPRTLMVLGAADGALGAHEGLVRSVVAELVYCGSLGAGYLVKLLNQYLKYSRFLAASEALTFAIERGIPIDVAIRSLLRGSAAEQGLGSAEEYFGGLAESESRRAPLSTIVKDVLLAKGEFDDAGISSATLEALTAFVATAGDTEAERRPYPESAALLTRYMHEPRKDV